MFKKLLITGLAFLLCQQSIHASDSEDEISSSHSSVLGFNKDNDEKDTRSIHPLVLVMMVNIIKDKNDDAELSNNTTKNLNNSDDVEEKTFSTLWQLPSEEVLDKDIKDIYFKEKTNIHKNLANIKLYEVGVDVAIETHCYDFIEYLRKSMDTKNLSNMISLTNLNKPILKKQIMKHAVKIEDKKAD